MRRWCPRITPENCTGLHRLGRDFTHMRRILLVNKDLGIAPNRDHVQSNLRGMSRFPLS